MMWGFPLGTGYLVFQFIVAPVTAFPGNDGQPVMVLLFSRHSTEIGELPVPIGFLRFEQGKLALATG
jgi:hypothetical protein